MKNYEKPLIMFESFKGNTNIVDSCEEIVTTSQLEVCTSKTILGTGGIVIFTSDVSGCKDKVPEPWNEICYHVPVATFNLFN